MAENNTLYLIPFFISALLAFGLAGYACNFLRLPGASSFAMLTLIQSAWTCSMIMEILSPTMETKRFWDSVQWLLIFMCVVTVFWFTLSIIPSRRPVRVPYALLLAFPVIFIGVMLVEPGLIYPSERVVHAFPFDVHDFEFSWVDWIAFLYIFAVLYYCVAVLAIERRRLNPSMRRQITWALFGIAFQTLFYQVMFITGVTFFGQRDTAPVIFLIGNMLMAWGLFRNRIFELGPTARSQVVENMPDGFIVTDSTGLVVDMNRSASVFAAPNWKRRQIVDVFPGWASEVNPELLGQPLIQDFVREVKGVKRSFELRVAPLVNLQRALMGYLVVVHDITHRKRLENALAASEARYRSIIDAMAEGLILYNQQGSVLACNHAAEVILGLPCAEISARSIGDLGSLALHEDETPFAEADFPIHIALRTGQPVRDVVMGLQTQLGGVKWLLINAQPFTFYDQDMEQKRQVIISFRDVTEMRRMQAETTHVQIAHERTRMLARFVESASHEFRTPLATISTSIYLLTRQPDAGKRQHHADTAQEQIKQIEQLLETLVNLVQLDSGAPLKRVPTHLDQLVNSILIHFESVIRDHRFQMLVEILPSVPPVMLDPYFMRLALQEILDNAFRYTPDGGRIAVRLFIDSNAARMTIQDSGSGIGEAERKHIFDPFWRQDQAHSTPGFGLGLSIVEKVVQQHEGTITVESGVGQGTTVTLRLPLKEGVGE